MSEWTRTSTPPTEDKVVMTKIDNAQGCRNEQALMRQGNLWFSPDKSMYVYYTPTHWREMTAEERKKERGWLIEKAKRMLSQAEALKKQAMEI